MTVAPTPVQGRPEPHRHQLPWLLAAAALGAGIAIVIQQGAFDTTSSSSGVQGSGTAATQTRELPAFSAVDLAGSNNVAVRVGDTQSVVVAGDDNLLARVTTVVQSGTLVIGTRGSFATKVPMRVEVTVPTLQALKLSGSGIVTAANIDAQRLSATLSGSGVLRASGNVTRLDVSLDGSGDAQLDALAAQDVHAVVSGSGRILVQATNTLDASVPGTGAIMYIGNPPHVMTSITGTGAVIPATR